MLTKIEMAMVIALVLVSSSTVRAHDPDRSAAVVPTGSAERTLPPQADARPTPWPAPVGHRQPRAADIPVERPQKRDADLELERLERALDGKLRICSGC